ncbi:MAG TPA: hypothetical protein VK164_08080 [Flavobacterium sp.]|uniref:hypothetical protein n=1 Tax=Flavobacterium sp. TaxID=239 RepID=UPI002B4B550E|nr:hypothetical protein [Flavobacterium sp.]HLO73877.1 hypothetical protein [Flavobacterium sp.]
MELNYEKLKEYNDKLNQESLKEIYNELPESFIQFTNSEIINHCLHQVKVGTKNEQSARVLNSWINSDVIFVKDEDKGKIRRFDRLESIWLNIVVEARKFGLPLESLKQTRKDLTQSPIKNFSLLKFSIINTIIREPQVLMILEDGYAKVISHDTHWKRASRALYPTHILFNLTEFISLEYPQNALSVDFKISNPYESNEKMTFLYFLKTGDFKSIQLHVKTGDVRLIEDPRTLVENKEIMKYISSWGFVKAEIILNDGTKTTITL